ncbi:porin family protein [Pinibacter aurantiacus]|uniref:PorT family protein n=1 Tax=Pinibacter aurantiacus TaxID=2851599 RepID=A0A9E2S6W5_9BACT|nr:porin family protein [Pinibacter aurantiacus]MBV4355524.1 PorT family protein [Pinibacter aurantiacus]
MKKILFASLLFVSSASFAQKFQLGVKGGVNISNFTGGDFQDAKKSSLVGFHAGAFVNYKFGQVISLQPEVLFSTQGATIEDRETGHKEDFKLNYVSIPVLLKVQSPGGFYVETGPVVSVNVSGGDFENQSVKDVTKGADFSWAAGLGFHSKIGLGIGARYVVGLSKVGDINNASVANADFKNSVIQVGLFYTLFNNK